MDFMETLKTIGGAASSIVVIITLLTLIIKPLRDKLFGIAAQKDGIKCLLRNGIIRIYYSGIDKKAIEQYEFENLSLLYKSYKALNGNCFVDKIYEEITDEWAIIKK